MRLPPGIRDIVEDYCGTIPQGTDVRYSIKIDNKEYQVKDTRNGPKIHCELGWIDPEKFIEFLLWNERMNSLIDLASIGLDRLISKHI
jgi:hypothetical protein